MRCFIAVPCPDEIKEKLVEVQGELEKYGKMKFVERKNIHLTLKFLGDVGESQVDEIKPALGFLTSEKKFDERLQGVGVFPNPSYVRVVWAGIEEGSGELTRLSWKIDEALKKFGFKKENKFHLHYTLARVKYVKDKKTLQDYLNKNSTLEFGRYTVDEIDLMESRLTPQGPLYSKVGEYRLR